MYIYTLDPASRRVAATAENGVIQAFISPRYPLRVFKDGRPPASLEPSQTETETIATCCQKKKKKENMTFLEVAASGEMVNIHVVSCCRY